MAGANLPADGAFALRLNRALAPCLLVEFVEVIVIVPGELVGLLVIQIWRKRFDEVVRLVVVAFCLVEIEAELGGFEEELSRQLVGQFGIGLLARWLTAPKRRFRR